MEPLRLKLREPVMPSAADIDNWDDDDFMLDDDVSFNGRLSNGPIMPQSPSCSSHRRDSHSSHMSFRSERDSLNGEERHIMLPEDEKSTMDAAIQAAANMGIPLPENVPASALMGGAIKRLGGRKVKKVEQDDWAADLAFPVGGQKLSLKKHDASMFPDSLHHLADSAKILPSQHYNLASNPLQPPPQLSTYAESGNISPKHINLASFRDADEDDDDFFGGETIRVFKRNHRQPISMITPPTPQQHVDSRVAIASADDDFEVDLELPSDGKLTLSKCRDIPRAPISHNEDLDWGDGSSSLGTRYGGTRREMRGARSSSASALSPSVGSTMTIESEDDAFEGLELPPGVLDLEHRLNTLSTRRKSHSPDPLSLGSRVAAPPVASPTVKTPSSEKEDFLAGIEIGDGSLLDGRKNTLHKNIKRKNTSEKSPPRIKATASITFTNKPIPHQSSSQSRLPRLSLGHTTQSVLEPVSESGGPIQQRANRRPPSRVGQSQTSGFSGLPASSSTSSLSSTAPRRREVGTKTGPSNLREPTTTNSQLLRMKRSLPVLRGPSAAKTISLNRPVSRADSGTSFSNRPVSLLRPKTPADTNTTPTSVPMFGARKASTTQNMQQSLPKPLPRPVRRQAGDMSLDSRPTSRTVSRGSIRSPGPRRYRANEKATLDGTWRQFSKPKTRHFGDGHELDAFDDLPTSASAEAKFTKAPITTGPKAALRDKLYANIQTDQRNTSPSPAPFTPTSTASTSSTSYTPRFARETASSRIAREASLAQRTPSFGTPGSQIPTPRVAQLSSRTAFSPGVPSPVRSRKTTRKTQQKPHLISNMGGGKESKTVNGMCYNPDTFLWEGNDGALAAFEPPTVAPAPAALTIPALAARDREHAATAPRPALITNISGTKGIQVVGGMVFDPQNMCWLKISHHQQQRGPRSRPSSSNLFSATTSQTDVMESIEGDEFDDDSDEDPFKDIPDLKDNTQNANDASATGGRAAESKDDWLVGEEFDVGPEFVRRQREEEDRWRKKCEKWLTSSTGKRDQESWRWTLRDLVVGDFQL